MTPRRPGASFQSLPPILRIENQIPIPAYSKGAKGLSVLLRVRGIFTATTISLGISSRQRTTRCTIRAGRNLPDKEFRYLRTVIVTADIHGGLDQQLSPPVFTFPHWSRVTPYTSSYELAESYVFAKQSVVPFHCGSPDGEHPFYRRYGANLPSSLRRFNPRALEYSSRIPVSVCGTGTLQTPSEAFLGSRTSPDSPRP